MFLSVAITITLEIGSKKNTQYRISIKLIISKKSILKIALVIILMTIEIQDFDFDNILLDEKSYENILVYDISYKTLICAKPLRIRFHNVDGFIRY